MSKTTLRAIEQDVMKSLPGACQGSYGTRRKFSIGSPYYVTLDLPTMIEEKNLRWLLRGDPGARAIPNAYRNAGISALMPPAGMQACIYEVLRTKWYNPATNLWELGGWGHSCAGFFQCFTNYVTALRRDRKRGRIDIKPGVTVPSPNEIHCIRNSFTATGNLEQSYGLCDAGDILPPRLDELQYMLSVDAGISFYEAIKVLSAGPDKPPPPPPPTDHAPPDAEKSSLLLYGAAAVLAILAIKRK